MSRTHWYGLVALPLLAIAAIGAMGPETASAEKPIAPDKARYIVPLGQTREIRLRDCDETTDPSVACTMTLIAQGDRRHRAGHGGEPSIQLNGTWTDICRREWRNYVGNLLAVHQQNANVTFDDWYGQVKLNWMNLGGTGTSFPGWAVDYTTGPTSSSPIGSWTSNLNVSSQAQFSLTLFGVRLDTIVSAISYNATASGGSCSYY